MSVTDVRIALPNDARERLFSPVRLGGVHLPNRLAVAPMTRISATGDGHATTSMVDYYRAFADGGFGLVITEGIYTDKAYAQGYFDQPGLTDAAQVEAWRAVVDGVHASGGKIIAQLMHAGALAQGNTHRNQGMGPSAVQPKGQQMEFYRGSGPYRMPAAMSESDIEDAVGGFAEAAQRAASAGFDGVEVHGANGYLLDQFLTDYTNRRTDSYGGGIAERVQLILEVVRAVRASVGSTLLLGVRIAQAKVNDFEHKWAGGQSDAEAVFSSLADAGADYIHTTEFEAWQPAFGSGPSLAALAKQLSHLPVIANGSLHDPARASALLAAGDVDLVSIGRGALGDPSFADRVRRNQPVSSFDPNMLKPLATLGNADVRAAGDCFQNAHDGR